MGQLIEGTYAIEGQLMYCTYAIVGQLIDCIEINVHELNALSFNMRVEASRGVAWEDMQV